MEATKVLQYLLFPFCIPGVQNVTSIQYFQCQDVVGSCGESVVLVSI